MSTTTWVEKDPTPPPDLSRWDHLDVGATPGGWPCGAAHLADSRNSNCTQIAGHDGPHIARFLGPITDPVTLAATWPQDLTTTWICDRGVEQPDVSEWNEQDTFRCAVTFITAFCEGRCHAYICTQIGGHPGPHIARYFTGDTETLCAVWQDGSR